MALPEVDEVEAVSALDAVLLCLILTLWRHLTPSRQAAKRARRRL
jgi:hypothetical protein